MKKFLSSILCAAMLFSGVAFAESSPMQDALASVKNRIDIPAELTEFDSRTLTRADTTTYSFIWHSEDASSQIEVSCDKDGRIINYWDGRMKSAEKELELTDFDRKDAKALAERFLKKAMPEAFSADDTLVCKYEDGRLTSRGTYFTFAFIREKNGIAVNGERISVNVIATADSLYIENMSADYDYDANFILSDTLIASPEDAYKTAFPLKLHYIKDYEASENSEKDITRLVYTVKDYGNGYISASTGETITETHDGDLVYSSAASGGGSNSAMRDEAAKEFSQEELLELQNVAGLKTPEEIEQILRGFSDLKMTENLKLQSYEIYKNSAQALPIAKNSIASEDKYTMNIRFRDEAENRYLYATLDAKNGSIISITNRKYQDMPVDAMEKQATDAQKALSGGKISGFFKLVAPDIFAEFSESDAHYTAQNADISFVRMVNGVEYSANNAHIAYDIENEMISSYSVSYTEAEFADPAPAIEREAESYNALLTTFPLERLFIHTANGYELCYKMSGYSDIDALTGIIDYEGEKIIGNYTDIGGHWAQNAINALGDVGIGFDGKEFLPNQPITKAELLTLFASGLEGRDYSYYGKNELMAEMKRLGLLAPQEPIEDGDKPVKREDACVYMIRIAGHEKIAVLDIFKTQFSDQALISPEKLGAAAILSGMKVICGDGTNLRPQDNITRAEAAMMLYNYLHN